MAVRVEVEPGWEENIQPEIDAYLADELGPAIGGDAQRYAPVKTGELRESERHYLEGHILIVEFTADYAAYVEMGHRIAHGPRMSEVGPKVVAPRPYLRPALYQERG